MNTVEASKGSAENGEISKNVEVFYTPYILWQKKIRSSDLWRHYYLVDYVGTLYLEFYMLCFISIAR